MIDDAGDEPQALKFDTTVPHSARMPYRLRSPEQPTAFFDGLSLLEPGVVPVSRWRPEPRPDGQPPRHVDTFGGMARKG